jgi:hypothetical protein
LLDRLGALLNGDLALLAELFSGTPQEHAQPRREDDRDADEQPRVLELKMRIEKVVLEAPLVARPRLRLLVAHRRPVISRVAPS